MSMVHERIKIGVESEGTTKLIDNLDLDGLTYDLVDEGGEVFAAEQGVEAITKLRKGKPDTNFLVLPA